MIPSGTGHERDGSDSGLAALAASLGPRLRPAATFATTEHFNLQTARAITVSEANGRAGIYLAALSCNLIALAFIGQMSQLGVAFYAFALILLPVLAFVAVSTFLRLVQSSIEEIAYAHRIGLLRGFYLRLAPYVVVVRETGWRREARTQRMATDAYRCRDGRGGQQCRDGGVRRLGAGSDGRPLACGPAGVRSSRIARTGHCAPRGSRARLPLPKFTRRCL